MMACRPLQYGDGLILGVTDFVDCQAQSLGWQGYAALAQPGSVLSALLTVLLTIYIGLHGYRMVLGHTPSARETVLAVVKIGVVLMLATSWPAYRVLIYDTAFRAPAELASAITLPAGLPSSGLAMRLQALDDNIAVLSRSGTLGMAAQVQDPESEKASGGGAKEAKPALPSRPLAASVYEPTAFDTARLVFLCSVIGAIALPRLLCGMLLGLGPFFIAFLLFDTSKRLTEGWLRALGGAAMASLGASVVLSVELALLAPWIDELMARSAQQLTRVGSPLEMLAIASIFAFMLCATLFGSARIAASLRLPRAHTFTGFGLNEASQPSRAGDMIRQIERESSYERSRADGIADAVATSDRRRITVAAVARGTEQLGEQVVTASGAGRSGPVRLGQSGQRRATRGRVSALSSRRDRMK